jgi:hypothetical protein
MAQGECRAGERSGSVSVRASKYRLCWVEAGGWSSGFQDARYGHGSPEEKQPAAIGGDMLATAGAEAEKIAELVVAAAEPGGRSRALEAPHGSVSAFDAPVVLLDGLIANDKFCLVRRTRLRLSWSRLSLRDRSARASAPSAEALLTGGTDAMPVDRASDDAADPGRPTPLGPGLDGGAGRRTCRRVTRPQRKGGQP